MTRRPGAGSSARAKAWSPQPMLSRNWRTQWWPPFWPAYEVMQSSYLRSISGTSMRSSRLHVWDSQGFRGPVQSTILASTPRTMLRLHYRRQWSLLKSELSGSAGMVQEVVVTSASQNRRNAPIAALIFDMDGLLVDSEAVAAEALAL